MIKSDREKAIAALLSERGELAIGQIASLLGRVSAITVRRDVARLAARGIIGRAHGGAYAIPATPPIAAGGDVDTDIAEVDAIVLPPIRGRSADTLRLGARRRRIPFLAESAPQEGGVYLGPDNFAVGRDLGRMAGRRFHGSPEKALVLIVTLQELPNTRARSDGFVAGFVEACGASVRHWRVDGKGSYLISLRTALDAFATHPGINVVFGVNDHSVLAALDAAERLGILNVAGYSIGGEGAALFDALSEGGRLVACGALFPEVVGMRAADVLADALAGRPMPEEVQTPYAILDSANLGRYYHREETGWVLDPAVAKELGQITAPAGAPVRGRSIGFLPHYPAHDWYRNMARSMQLRAAERGIEVKIAAPQAGIAREIKLLRELIARTAADHIAPGETILINAGAVAPALAHAVAARTDITVITNSLDVLEHLNDRPGIKVILTSGEYQSASRCLVGPSLGALFETLRVDTAFLSIDGISSRFGVSSTDERLALAARRFVNASRRVVVLADHSLVGFDATHRVVPVEAVHELVTDSGSLPADRLAFAATGMRVALADELEQDSAERAGDMPSRRFINNNNDLHRRRK